MEIRFIPTKNLQWIPILLATYSTSWKTNKKSSDKFNIHYIYFRNTKLHLYLSPPLVVTMVEAALKPILPLICPDCNISSSCLIYIMYFSLIYIYIYIYIYYMYISILLCFLLVSNSDLGEIRVETWCQPRPQCIFLV